MKIAISAIVIVHLIAAMWHGDAHSTLDIELPALKIFFVYVVILAAPVAGVILLWTRAMIVGAGLFALSMLAAAVFGAYHHYILVSPDNIAHLPAGPAEAQAQFIDSAALIGIIELVAALVGSYALGYAIAARKKHF